MNRFKISLLTIQHQTGSNASKFILNTISEFYDQTMNADFPMEYTTFAYTYDEKFSIHINAQKELSFKMDRYVTRSDAIEENPFTQNIVIGSQLLLEDTNARQHLFTVNKIGYTFYENNTTYQYSCVDSFTYQLGRQNDGYTINNDVSTSDFLGSHTVDWWVQKIILPDCKISYTYKQLTEAVIEHGILVKHPIAQDSLYNRTVLFSGSGTANSILISLGESNELMLNTYEHYESDGTLTTYFWYEPKKHAENSGLRYSPYSDIKTFSLTHDGNSLSTVFNIQTHSINDNLISLFPPVTPFFNNYFLSDQWDSTSYSAGVFHNLIHGISYHLTPHENALLTIPNEIITLWNNSTTYSSGAYVYLSKTTGSPEVTTHYVYRAKQANTNHDPTLDTHKNYWAIIYQTTSASIYMLPQNLIATWFYKYYPYMSFTSFNKQVSYYQPTDGSNRYYSSQSIWKLNGHDADYVWSYQDNIQMVILDLHDNALGNASLYNYDIYITFYRDPTAEDLEFADIADECPWLENKLIDFSYYQTHNILNKPELEHLNKLIQQDLRHINGRLLVYAQDYYNALHQKTKLLSEIINNLDMIGATFESDIVQSLSKPGTMWDSSNFSKQCEYINEIYNRALVEKEKIGMLNLSDTLSEYVNDYVNHEQSFLKNIFNFRKYFDAPISILGQNSILYDWTFTITNDDYKFYGVSLQPLLYDPVLDATLVDDNYHPSVPLYEQVANSEYTPIDDYLLVDQLNADTFYIPNIKTNDYVAVEEYIPDTKYYILKLQGKASGQEAWTPASTITCNGYNFRIEKINNNNIILSICDYHYATKDDYLNDTTGIIKVLSTDTSAINLNKVGTTEVKSNSFTWSIIHQRVTTTAILKNAWYNTTNPNWYSQISIPFYPIAASTPDASTDWPTNSAKLFWDNTSQSAGNGTLKTSAMDYAAGFLSQMWLDSGNSTMEVSTAQLLYAKYFNTDLYFGIEDSETEDINYYRSALVNATNEQSMYRRVVMPTPTWKLFLTAALSPSLTEAGLTLLADRWIKIAVAHSNNDNFNLTGRCMWDVDGNGVIPWTSFDILMGLQYLDPQHLYFTKTSDAYNRFLDLTDKQYWPQYIYPTYYTYTETPSGVSSPASFYYKTNWWRVMGANDIVTRNSTLYIVADEYLCFLEENANTCGVQFQPYLRLNKQIYYPLQSCMEILDTAMWNWDEGDLTLQEVLTALFGTNKATYHTGGHYWTITIDNSGHDVYIFSEEDFDLEQTTSTNLSTTSVFMSDIDSTYRPLTLADLTTPAQWTGIYTIALEDAEFQPATTYTEDGNYYYSADGQTDFIKAYTYKQCVNFYYYPCNKYTMSSFDLGEVESGSPWTTNISLPYYLNDDNAKIDMFSIQWQLCQLKGRTYNPTTYKYSGGLYLPDGTTQIGIYEYTETQLQGLTNGEFWTQYHTNEIITNNVLTQYCSIIETNLTEYWQQAYAASKYCKFFLPESWLPRTENGSNPFYQGIVGQTKIDTYTTRTTLSSRYIPEVQPIPNCSRYVFKHYNTNNVELAQDINNYQRTNLSYNDIDSVNNINNEAITQMLVDDLSLDPNQWFAVTQYDNYVYYKYMGGGTTWQDALSLFTRKLVSNEYFNGWDIMMIGLLQSGYYINYEPTKYYEYQQKHDQLWREIYQNYPSVILEKSFKYEDATNSRELLEAAQIAFNQYKQVERQYNIGIIKFDKLKGNSSQPLAIGDSIELQADEFYNGQDDISKSLTQLLFITDMSYTLRNPADMSITVNTIKYTDKVIKELLHLIR